MMTRKELRPPPLGLKYFHAEVLLRAKMAFHNDPPGGGGPASGAKKAACWRTPSPLSAHRPLIKPSHQGEAGGGKGVPRSWENERLLAGSQLLVGLDPLSPPPPGESVPSS